ncbi:MAG: YggS family pyridoxal phosphate-dependent enzyme [Planctomycetia bacterium]|nr:YggS family pyridoxal phosphate-dependent enzyme [Planctomycetia bacterium]
MSRHCWRSNDLMTDLGGRIAENLARVRGRIADAARKSGREPGAITLLAVTKYVPAEIAAALVKAGCTELGESRPQELWSKAAELADPAVRWHLIGHLQRNKIRRTLPLVHLVQSIDSRRLLSALNDDAAELGLRPAVLLEVNISGEITKTGLPPGELKPLLEKAEKFSHVKICGLMGMASLTGGAAAARRDFAQLRRLRDRLAAICPADVSLSELSMGMSGDFEVAIDEGATIVRVGSALFEGVPL